MTVVARSKILILPIYLREQVKLLQHGPKSLAQGMKEYDNEHERKGGQISVIHSRQRFCMFIHLFLFYFIE